MENQNVCALEEKEKKMKIPDLCEIEKEKLSALRKIE